MTSDSTAAALIPADVSATVVLVRHGESTYISEGRFQGRHDPALSSIGERQAALVAERLRDPSRSPALPIPVTAPTAVWHSPLRRARQTAEAIAARQASPPRLISSEAFVEIAQGQWEGLTHDEVRSFSPDVLDGWRRDPLQWNAPGGERLVDAATRVQSGIEAVVAALARSPQFPARSPVPGYADAVPDHPWVLLVAHDGIFRLALLCLLGLPLDRFWTFPFVLCGVTVLELRDGRVSLIAHNLAEHLAPLAAQAVAETEARDRAGAL